MKQIIVQKFGGTCLQNDENRMLTARMIWKARRSEVFPVVIVSAMGRKGDPYATDTLLNLCHEAYEEVRPREKDLLLSCGEIISAVIIAQNLEKMGLKAKAFTGFQAGIITDEMYGGSNVIGFSPQLLQAALDEDSIPVIAGFQGMSVSGEITTLGRGGSDTSASLIAICIKAIRIEIYSDVEGIYSADPRLINTARLLEEMNYQEVFEMANQGAKVIHPKAVMLAEKENIPIYLKHLYLEEKKTIINFNAHLRPVTAITSKNKIIFVELKGKEKSAHQLAIFSTLAEHHISVDFIDIRPHEITFITNEENKNELAGILQKMKYKFSITDRFVKVSVIGSGMTGVPGIMAKVVQALRSADIKIYQTTDSHTTISCLVKAKDEQKAIASLHEEFNLTKEL